MIETVGDRRRAEAGAVGRERLAGLLAVAAVIVALLIPVAVTGASLGKPYIMDEMEFPSVARAIAETGRPVYYRGELYPANIGLWHPPLYIAWYAGWMKLFGASTESGRAFGVLNICLALALIGAFALRRAYADAALCERRSLLPLALLGGLAVGATSPLLVQGAVLPDIDTQVLPLMIIAFFLLLFELRRRGLRERRYWLVFVLALTFQFFAKLTTPVLLLAAFAVFEVVRAAAGADTLRVRWSSRRVGSRPRTFRLLVSIGPGLARTLTLPLLTLAAGAASFALLVIVWGLVARLWGVSFALPFTYLMQSTNNPANYGGSQGIVAALVASAPAHFAYLTQWIGYPMLAWLLLLAVRELAVPTGGILSRAERMAVFTFVVLLAAMYIVLRPAPFMFPKYWPPLVPLLALLAVDLLLALLKERRHGLLLGLGAVELLAYLMYASGSFGNQDFIYRVYHEWPKDPLYQAWMLGPLLGALVLGGVLWIAIRRQLLAALLVGALAVSLGWQTHTVAVQSRVPYSTTYHYGEKSLGQLADHLRATLPPGAVLIAPKDVGYLLQDRWRYYELTPDPRPLLDRPGVQYLVMREKDYYGNTIRETPEIAGAVNARYEAAARIGDFVVLRRKQAG
ncbi:MAG TPA: hypothetical protein VNL77_18440 [Roseiflexaceae bacterium]|nr:hypothetical protein [Roseiflexaceae bacterium]